MSNEAKFAACLPDGSMMRPSRSEEVYTFPTPDDALALLRAELIGFRETPKGPSGKASDRNDDAAMAFVSLKSGMPQRRM